ncbi:TrbC/VirB2 family protein [Escherichia coli]|uniref:TrbC/VirB2 family protein n=1 Tax=Escherichia coli TaxID=562 RepID=UPI000F0AA2BD|nr:TrbC/VirB2 family protein [Escherichia coli]
MTAWTATSEKRYLHRILNRLQKIIDFLTDIRKPAITIIALVIGYIAIFSRQHTSWIVPLVIGIIIFIVAPYIPDWLA